MDPMTVVPTVPAGCASVLDACCSTSSLDALGGALVVVGERVELDLDAVTAVAGAGAARALATYWESARSLARRGGDGSTEVVAVRRRLGSWRQGTGRHKSDLGEQLAAMGQLGPGVAETVAELLGPCGDGERTEEVAVLARDLPGCLGGPATVCEQRRVLVLTARYAQWRDRQVRRLAVVEAHAEEVWPAPGTEVAAAWQRAWPATGS